MLQLILRRFSEAWNDEQFYISPRHGDQLIQYGRRRRTLAAAQIEALLAAGLHVAKGKSLLLSATVAEQNRGIGDRPRLLDRPLRPRTG